MPIIAVERLYTLGDAARALGTHRPRVRQLIEWTGVQLMPVGGARVMTGAQLKILTAAHKANPIKPRGRPRKRDRGPSAN